MFRCIRCLKTLSDANASREHVFPDAIGGVITLKDICVPCNSDMGSKIDAPLVNHRYMQWARKKHRLATRSGRIPNPAERVDIPETGQRARWDHDGAIYFIPQEVLGDDGNVVLRVDETDEHRLPEMITKAKRRRGVDVRGEVMRRGASVSLSFDLGFEDQSYRLGMLKIAYELGCKLLGPTYLDDPIAARFRSVLAARLPTDQLVAEARLSFIVRGLYGSPMLGLPGHSDSWLSGVVFAERHQAVAYVRLFDRFDGSFVLSETVDAYACTPQGRGWITDVAQRTLRETSLDELRALASTRPVAST